mgnify:CR=1 FL=1|tara:strand:- start:3385 stop:4752 length:1368 start_codon:yes stop_codon:yes gene_type:complete
MQYFYDKQIRRHLIQFVRMFSNFSVQIGENDDGDPIYRTVPAKYGDPTRMAATIMRENSENKMLSVPQITCYITGMSQDPSRRMHAGFQKRETIYEKDFNSATGDYTTDPGNTYQITKTAPVPYILDINVDVWTSNTDQKLQLMEQLLILFDPLIDLHSSKNPFDWTALSYNELSGIQFSSRSQPIGTEDIIDIGTLQFRSMIYLTPPAKFNRSKLIHTILTQLYTMDADQVDLFQQKKSYTYDSLSYTVITPSQYWIEVTDATTVKITNQDGTTIDSDGNTLNWETILAPIGRINSGYSQLRLRLAGTPDDDDSDVIGTIAYDAGNVNHLTFTIDDSTLPATTQTAVDRIVNPNVNYPGDGTLPAAAAGQRYILTDKTTNNNSSVWASIAGKGDIIQNNGFGWEVSFDASANGSTAQYVTNTADSQLYFYNGSNEIWTHAWQAKHKPGFWRIFI